MYKNIIISTLMLFVVALAVENTQISLSNDLSPTDAILVPRLLNYQGKLTNLAGTPVADSTYAITFRLFTTATVGSAFWSETQNVPTNQGIFNVLLGSNNPIESIPRSGNCYLEMQVGAHPAMSPRIRLVSSAYAYLSKKSDTANYALSANITYVDSARISTNAHKLQGKDTIALSNKYVDEGQINAITNLMIIDNAITSAKIQDGTIQLIDLAFTPATRPLTPPVSNAEISDNAVTTGKIQNGTILREDVVTTFKAPYADTSDYARNIPAVTYVDSARVSVNAHNAHRLQGKDTLALSAKFVDEGQANSITSAMIVDNAITTGKILDGAITTAKIADNNVTTAKIADNAITTGKILNNTILREDVVTNFKAPYADTSDFVRNVSVAYVDSARVSVNAHNAHKLQGKDTLALSAKYVDEGQVNAITSPMILDNAVTTGKILNNTILREDVSPSFKAPYADTADFARLIPGAIDSARVAANAHKLQGKDTLALSAKFVDEGQVNSITNPMIVDNAVTSAKIIDNAVTTGKILNNTILREDVSLTFKAPYADTSDYARNIPVVSYVDSARISVNAHNAHKLQGKDTLALSAKFVDEGQTNAITTTMIVDNAITTGKILNNTILREDVSLTFKAPLADTADYARYLPGAIDSARVAANAHKLQGKDTIALSAKFVDEAQVNAITTSMITDNAVTTTKILDGAVTNAKLGANAVTTDKILDGTITTADLSFTPATRPLTPGVSSTEILDGAVITAKIADNAITTGKIQDGQVQTADIADGNVTNVKIAAGITDTKLLGTGTVISNFNADLLDGQHAAAFALTGHTHTYVDSARISANTHKLQGKDTLALSAKFVDEGQTAAGDLTGTYPNPTITTNAITTTKILDGAVTNPKLGANAVTTDKIFDGTITTADLSFIPATRPLTPGVASTEILDGAVTNTKLGANAVTTDKISDGTIVNADISATAGISDSKLSGTTTLVTNFNADLLDGQHATAFALTGHTHTYVDSARISANTHKLQGKDTLALSAKFVDEGQSAAGDLTGTYPNPVIATGAVNSAKILDGSIRGADIAKPCTLSAAAAHILFVNNTGGAFGSPGIWTSATQGPGIFVKSGLQASVYVDSTGVNSSGLYIRKTTRAGVEIDSSDLYGIWLRGKTANDGVRINRAESSGVYILRARNDGVYVDSVGDDGFAVARAGNDGVWIRRAVDDGIQIDTCGWYGLWVRRAICGVAVGETDRDGMAIDNANWAGLVVGHANWSGVEVGRAQEDGVYVARAQENGVFVDSVASDGVQINTAGATGVYIKNVQNYHGLHAERVRRDGIRIDSAGQRGGYFRNYNNLYYALEAINNTGTGGTVKGLYVQGAGYATGGWSTKMGDKSGFAVISPNVEVMISGTGSLSNGIARIDLDPNTRNVLSENIPLKVIITPNAECNGICVTEKSASGFTVKELLNGKSNASFDWIAIGRIKDYEQTPDLQPASSQEEPRRPEPIQTREIRTRERAIKTNQ